MAIGTATAIAAGVSALSNVVSGVAANQTTSAARKKAEEAGQKALEMIQQVGAGPDLAREIILEQYKQAGVYTPQLEKQITQEVSKVSELQERAPETREAQVGALEAFKELGRTGLSAADRGALNQLRRDVETANRGRLEAIRQQMQQRGMGGAGAELAAQLQQSQSATGELAAGADRLAQQSQQARMAALQQQAGLASGLRSQDFGVDLARAQAADELTRFNTQQQIGLQQRNVGSLNEAQLRNLQEQQRIQDANIAQQNAELQRQRAAEQQEYLNRLGAAQAGASALTGQAQTQVASAQQQAQNIQAVGSGIGQIGTGIAIAANQPAPAQYDTKTGQKIVKYDPITGKPVV
jgi:hypothetical protein